ncbi:MAG: hypothetical protein MZV70_49360 [Desulfobacterales bacterium]|nr:hypothetical protein [Desulfobacterales bacterium]
MIEGVLGAWRPIRQSNPATPHDTRTWSRGHRACHRRSGSAGPTIDGSPARRLRTNQSLSRCRAIARLPP